MMNKEKMYKQEDFKIREQGHPNSNIDKQFIMNKSS